MSKINLNPNEKIIILRRRHWYFLASGVFLFLALAIIPFFIYLVLSFFRLDIITQYTNYLWGLIFLYLFALVSRLYKFWIDYYLDMWIVTNQRIFDIEQKGLFSREVAIFNLANVQDVSVNMSGPLALFLDFGEVHIQTAGEAREFIFHQVSNPYEIQKQIVNLSRNLIKK